MFLTVIISLTKPLLNNSGKPCFY